MYRCKLISFNGKNIHACFLFVFAFLGSIWLITSCISIKYTKEEFHFGYTSNHTADLNEGCLKTVDIFNCSSIFVVELSVSPSFYCHFIFTEQKSCRNLLHWICFFFSPCYSLVFLLVTLMMLGSVFYYCFGCEAGKRKKDERVLWKWDFVIETSVQLHP